MSEVSLLDLRDDVRLAEWYIVYYARTPYFKFTEWLKQGFRHCDLWRPHQFGPATTDVLWLRLKPTFEILESYIDFDPSPPWVRHPDATVQKVQTLSKAYRVREWFSIGPPTCVETCKNALGINSFFTRTPWQLYQYIKRRDGVIK
jgi:hypothetical protein